MRKRNKGKNSLYSQKMLGFNENDSKKEEVYIHDNLTLISHREENFYC